MHSSRVKGQECLMNIVQGLLAAGVHCETRFLMCFTFFYIRYPCPLSPDSRNLGCELSTARDMSYVNICISGDSHSRVICYIYEHAGAISAYLLVINTILRPTKLCD